MIMEPNRTNDKTEADMQKVNRRLDTALTVISIVIAAAFIGLGAYTLVWHIILPLLGVETC